MILVYIMYTGTSYALLYFRGEVEKWKEGRLSEKGPSRACP